MQIFYDEIFNTPRLQVSRKDFVSEVGDFSVNVRSEPAAEEPGLVTVIEDNEVVDSPSVLFFFYSL